MDVTIPEAGDDGFSGAIDDPDIIGNRTSLRLPIAVITPLVVETTASVSGAASGDA